MKKERGLAVFYNLFYPKQLYVGFPQVMQYLPGPHNKLFSNFNATKELFHEEIEKHKKELDRNNPRDYIDAFLIEMENVCRLLFQKCISL